MHERNNGVCLLSAVLLLASGCPGSGLADSDGQAGAGDDGERDGGDGTPGDSHDGATETDTGLPEVDVPARCGDGIVDPDEECDDGNRLDGDECDWRCRHGRGDPYPWVPDPAVGEVADDLPWAPIGGSTVGDLHAGAYRVPLVWTGAAYATVWTDGSVATDSGDTARFLRFDTAGRALGPEWSYNFEDRGFSPYVDLAWSGSRFALVWSTWSADVPDRPLSAMILDEAGKRLFGPVTLFESPEECAPAVAWDGEAFVTVWANGTPPTRIGFIRFDDTAAILAPPVWIHTTDGEALGDPVVAASPDAIVVLFDERAGACGSPRPDHSCWRWLAVDRGGSPSRAPVSIGPVEGATPVIGWARDRFAMAIPTGIDRCPGLHVAILDHSGSLVAAPVAFCTSTAGLYGGSRGLSIGWGAGGWALAFVPGTHPGIIRTDAMGVPVNEILVESLRLTRPGIGIAFDGSGFGLVACGEAGPLFARYVIVP